MIWFISGTHFEAYQQPISAKELEEKVVNYLRLISGRSEEDDDERRRDATELYALLIGPVAHLLDSAKLLCIVPDKILNRLPYAALAASAQGGYLIENYALTFSPSSTMFVRRSKTALERVGPGPERLLSVGDPQFDHQAFPSYRYLPAARVEAREIAALYGVNMSKFRSIFRINGGELYTEKISDNYLLFHEEAAPSEPCTLKGKVATKVGVRLNLDQPESVAWLSNGVDEPIVVNYGERLLADVKLICPTEDQLVFGQQAAHANNYYKAVGHKLEWGEKKLFSSTKLEIDEGDSIPISPEASCLIGRGSKSDPNE